MPLITLKQASQMTGVSGTYLRRLCANGRLKTAQKFGKTWIVSQEEVEALPIRDKTNRNIGITIQRYREVWQILRNAQMQKIDIEDLTDIFERWFMGKSLPRGYKVAKVACFIDAPGYGAEPYNGIVAIPETSEERPVAKFPAGEPYSLEYAEKDGAVVLSHVAPEYERAFSWDHLDGWVPIGTSTPEQWNE